MGVQKKTRKFAEVKRVIGKNDARRKENLKKAEEAVALAKRQRGGPDGETLVREIPQVPAHMFFQANTALVPPYSVLVDTSFFSRTVQMKLPLLETMMDCLYATCHPVVTDCVMAELEKLGPKFRIPLRIARDERWQRLKCQHKGVYADDCLTTKASCVHFKYMKTIRNHQELTDLSSKHRSTLSQPTTEDYNNVFIMKVARGKYVIERLPDAPV
ncbi:rRNA-processing protein FCF1-like protein [Colletotrichum chlorophyti]|uniref:rRNA-processing protein FCF1-like protein n=1 Tax=Colletotrichum chlorophyti TaxID=708187 RepID=A0A1Q8RCE6_9PEZI|nr:rRNA-processing protein FCF1-like protein [Colletotrichum chlorophyti]